MNIKTLIPITFACILVACSFSVSAAATPNGDISEYLNEGIVHFMSGEFKSAIEDFSNSVKLNPNDYFAYYQRAKAHENTNEIDKAIADYGQVIKTGPRSHLAGISLYYRGVLYQKRKHFDEAIADYTSIIENKEEDKIRRAHAYNNRGLIYDRQGRYDRAIYDYNKAIEIIPGMLNAHYNRGASYANYGAYPLAMEDFRKELEINPYSFAARRYNQALVYYGQKDYHRSWYEVFRLMRAGERVSGALVADLKRSIKKQKQDEPALLKSGLIE
ncbi:MAG: tetratricopeptide repeat protein [Deltaproteobacteria bacterium]